MKATKTCIGAHRFQYDYLNDDICNIYKDKTHYEWVEINNICELIKGTTQSSLIDENIEGSGVMVTQSKNVEDYKKISEYKLTGKNLFIGNIDSGKKFVIRFFDGNCDFTNLLSHCRINVNYKHKINIKYFYYILMYFEDYLTEKYLKGSCNLSLDSKNFLRIKIPIPNMNKQNEIVQILDIYNFQNEIISKYTGKLYDINLLHKLKEFIQTYVKEQNLESDESESDASDIKNIIDLLK
jgi:restriction endonuclease S subunit